MLCRPVLLSLPSTVVAFCGSLKLKIKALVRHPRRARKSINEQSIPPNIHEHLPVEMDGKYDRPITEGIAPNQQLPTTADDTSNTPFDSETGLLRSLLELDMPVFGGERTNSASSGAYSGSKINGRVLDYKSPSMTQTGDAPVGGSEQGAQGSRSPSPELLFTPLSPPPSHRRSRTVDPTVRPDDQKDLAVPICNEHLRVPCSQCSVQRQNEPLRFPF